MLKHGKTPVDTIIVHCSATQPDWMVDKPLSAKVTEITRWHKARKFYTIGYHWVIDRDGSVAPGRPESDIGAHVEGHNTGSIGICLIGGHGSSENDPFTKHFTPEQDMKLRELIEQIKTRANIKRVRGHNELSPKACPGFNVGRWLAKKSPKPAITESTTMRASAVQIISGAGAGVTAVSALEGTAQVLVILFGIAGIITAGWIMRKRIAKWAREVSP